MEIKIKSKIKIGDVFNRRKDCFDFFKSLIDNDKYMLCNEKTNDMPLDKVNKLIKKTNYVWLNILNDDDWKKFSRREDECFIVEDDFLNYPNDIIKLLYSKIAFQFVEKENGLEFMGIYMLTNRIAEGFYIYKRIEVQEIYIDEYKIKEIIENAFNEEIKYYLKDREALMGLLYENSDLFRYLPENLRNDEQLCLMAMESGYEEPLEYIGEKLKNNRSFALKAVNKWGSALQYFSEELQQDRDLREIALEFGYFNKNELKNKESLLNLPSFTSNIKEIPKELKSDKDILRKYWRDVRAEIEEYENNTCSIIAVDDFGNKVIDEFFKKENQICNKDITITDNENVSLIQFVKVRKYKLIQNEIIDVVKFDKDIFDISLKPIIVLIGENANDTSDLIKEKYMSIEDCYFIEIYKKNVVADNFKLITNDINKIIDFLRILVYIESNNDIDNTSLGLINIEFLLENTLVNDNLDDFEENLLLDKELDIYKFNFTIENLESKIKNIPKKFYNKLVMIEQVINKNIDNCLSNMISKIITDYINDGKEVFFSTYITDKDVDKEMEIILLFKKN